jgi:aryl-alcohol dehydrogenase-like predicted oxidoreductase
MKYKYLGNTGVKVSELCFGTMSFGGDADEPTSRQLFQYCRDHGINFFDCANIYNSGRSEEILGEHIQGCRKDVVITSKVYFPTSNDVNALGASRRHIMTAVEESLKRLKTDYIDIYFMHKFDNFTPLEETLRALDDLVHQGKILYTGASNYAAWQVSKALGISAKEGLARFACIQPMYSLVKRQAEVEILPMAQAENLGVIPYSPLAAGLLAGKYSKDKKPDSGRLIDNKVYKVRYGFDWMYKTADQFCELARKHDFKPGSLAVAWVAAHPAVTAPIIGARSLEQLESSVRSIEIEITQELKSKISALSPEPQPATDRSEEKEGVFFGKR